MSEFEQVQENLLRQASTLEISSERKSNEARIEELQERQRQLGYEIIRRISSGAI